jgi:hypothetical protein
MVVSEPRPAIQRNLTIRCPSSATSYSQSGNQGSNPVVVLHLLAICWSDEQRSHCSGRRDYARCRRHAERAPSSLTTRSLGDGVRPAASSDATCSISCAERCHPLTSQVREPADFVVGVAWTIHGRPNMDRATMPAATTKPAMISSIPKRSKGITITAMTTAATMPPSSTSRPSTSTEGMDHAVSKVCSAPLSRLTRRHLGSPRELH